MATTSIVEDREEGNHDHENADVAGNNDVLLKKEKEEKKVWNLIDCWVLTSTEITFSLLGTGNGV